MGMHTKAQTFTQRWRPQVSRKKLLGTAMAVAVLASGYSALSAWVNRVTPEQIALGQKLFEHKWTTNDALAGGGDGLGPVFNARSCAECHNQGAVGGGGGSKFNVQTFTAMPTRARQTVEHGVIHAFALNKTDQESQSLVAAMFPTPPPQPVPPGHCGYSPPPPPNPLVLETINTPALFGSGVIDEVSDFSIRSASMSKTMSAIGSELALKFDSVPVGRVRMLPGGRVGKFGWKGQFATLEEFVGAACAMEMGLSNSKKPQQVPRQHRDDPSARYDMTDAQLTAMVRFTAQLPVPVRSVSANDADECAEGEALFTDIGCARCHTPDVGCAKDVFTDFCLYKLDDQPSANYGGDPQVPLPSDEPHPAEWKTPPLWGVADSAPYMHDGSARTLAAAIQAHGGSAKNVRKRFDELSADKQNAVLAFLGSLKAPR